MNGRICEVAMMAGRRLEFDLSGEERSLQEPMIGAKSAGETGLEPATQSWDTSYKSVILPAVDADEDSTAADRPESPSADSSFLSTSRLDVEIAAAAAGGGRGAAPSWYTALTRVVYILLWGTLYAAAVQLEFGVIYLIVSALCLIWLNTRVGPKKEGEISAYSVFNPNCESIDGTLKAEQFEREIRYGAASVH